ncbi:hypothetical protein D3C80_1894450 [compost metagenome]
MRYQGNPHTCGNEGLNGLHIVALKNNLRLKAGFPAELHRHFAEALAFFEYNKRLVLQFL